MRTETEMMSLILHVAKEDDRVRAVGLNGSRTNPSAKPDFLQDYDIVFVVTDVHSFIEKPDWIDVFGKRLIMQTPEAMDFFPPEPETHFSYLMLFEDGNRIDLTLVPLEACESWNGGDSLAVVLLDKDGRLPDLPPPTDRTYWAKEPTSAFFSDCCNEFWWVSTYVAKGLWRKELLYAVDHLAIVRQMLLHMLEWKVGVFTSYSVSIGKNGKYLDRFLTEEEWKQLSKAYPRLTEEDIWEALRNAIHLFNDTAKAIANMLNFQYPLPYIKNVTAYIEHIRTLPRDA